MKNRRPLMIAVVLLLAILNFTRIKGNEVIRPIQYLSLLVIGALGGLLLNEFVTLFRAKRQ